MRCAAALLAVAIAVALSACGGSDGDEQDLPVPEEIAEGKAEQAINDYISTVRNQDWAGACRTMAPSGMKQIFIARAPEEFTDRIEKASNTQLIGICPQLLQLLYRGEEIPAGTVAPTDISADDDEVVVDSDAGTFRLTREFRIVSFPEP